MEREIDELNNAGAAGSLGRRGSDMANAYDPTQSVREDNVAVSKRLADRVTAAGSVIVQAIGKALQPYAVAIAPAPGGVKLTGDDVAVMLARQILEALAGALAKTNRPEEAVANEIVATVIDHALNRDLAFRLEGVTRPIRPMSMAQIAFLNTMLSTERALMLGVGPTGTGKTHLAVAAGLCLLARERVKGIIITRPHAAQPGEAVTPSVRAETSYDDQFLPIEDALHELIGVDETKRLTDRGQLMLMPLGKMRGRTFNDSFVLVDEAQNLSASMMRMAATRLGAGSRLVVTGDPECAELRSGEPSGLLHLMKLINGTDLAHLHVFKRREIIRNDFVAQIEELYARDLGHADEREAA